MVDRIKKVMEYYEFTPSDFADALGVSRSNLTHVFSGRNQPSLDFARRVLMAFPEISSEWLIMGVGEMIKPAGSEPEAPKKSYIQTDLFATAEEELGWSLDGNSEELGVRNEEVAESSEMSDVRSQKSDVRGQMSEGESEEKKQTERGDGSSEELVVRNEEKGENENENENEKEIPLLSRRGAEGGVVDNQIVERSDVRGQMSESKGEVRNVNSDPIEETFVTNGTNVSVQTQQQKITTNEKSPKMDTKQIDTKIVRQRRSMPSTSSESKIQHHPATGARIYDSREPISASEKKVVKIIFFYDDDSFKIYHP